ncbi:MAG: WYL domain-containing protein [Lysobacter sp.]|nr:WYL domain-containing protein [Lysobacter sp.]
MRASRLLSILMLLQLRDRLTADALAAEFEVSVRTIYRDIDRLAEAGVPVYADRGPGGGFRLVDGYRTRLTGLAADEVEAMFMIGLPGPAAALGMGPAASNAGRKMLAALPRSSGDVAGRMGARFHLDPVEWYRDDEPLQQLPAIARAVLDQTVLAMTYDSWRGVRERVVEPLGLVLKAGAWYLVARSDGVARIYKVANILRHEVRDTHFERPPDFDLATWWPAETTRFEAGLRTGTAQLRATALGLKRLSQLGAFAQRAVQTAAPADDEGWSCLSLPIETLDHAALTLLGIGPEIEVLAPDALRLRLRDLAAEVVHRST